MLQAFGVDDSDVKHTVIAKKERNGASAEYIAIAETRTRRRSTGGLVARMRSARVDFHVKKDEGCNATIRFAIGDRLTNLQS